MYVLDNIMKSTPENVIIKEKLHKEFDNHNIMTLSRSRSTILIIGCEPSPYIIVSMFGNGRGLQKSEGVECVCRMQE